MVMKYYSFPKTEYETYDEWVKRFNDDFIATNKVHFDSHRDFWANWNYTDKDGNTYHGAINLKGTIDDLSEIINPQEVE